MNRTQRAIKRQYRKNIDVIKKQKNTSIEKMKLTMEPANSLFNRKGKASQDVKNITSKEKEARKQAIEYKMCVLSEKKCSKEDVRIV